MLINFRILFSFCGNNWVLCEDPFLCVCPYSLYLDRLNKCVHAYTPPYSAAGKKHKQTHWPLQTILSTEAARYSILVTNTCTQILLHTPRHTMASREAPCDCILKWFASTFLRAKAKVLIYLYVFPTERKGMSCLRCFPPSRHSSLLTPGRSDLGRWQRRLFSI